MEGYTHNRGCGAPYPTIDAAVAAWTAAHPLPADTPGSHGICPVCDCAGSYGRLPGSDGWWFCFNDDPHPVGVDRTNQQHPGWAGDSLDLETHRRGYEGKEGRLRVLREAGYLSPSPALDSFPRASVMRKREPTPAELWKAGAPVLTAKLGHGSELASTEGLDAARQVASRPVARGYRRVVGAGRPFRLAELVPLPVRSLVPGLVLAAEPGAELLDGLEGDLLLVEPARWLEVACTTWAVGRWIGVLGLTDARPLVGALPWRGAVYVGPGLDARAVAAVLRPDPTRNTVLRWGGAA